MLGFGLCGAFGGVLLLERDAGFDTFGGSSLETFGEFGEEFSDQLVAVAFRGGESVGDGLLDRGEVVELLGEAASGVALIRCLSPAPGSPTDATAGAMRVHGAPFASTLRSI
ncbi:MAG TPA: hypothetical protein VFI18_08525 [Gaiellales bacterium]|nr:hypothetical protein [Gaiellales bacterium]